MTKFVTELLDEINADPASIAKHKGSAALKYVFDYAFDPAKKFVLPDGEPPFKKDAAPQGMSPGNLYQELRKFYIFCRTDLKALRRETLFVQLLENIHPKEAELVIAIKDQKLTKMYPKITHKLVHEAGFVAVAPPTKKAAQAKNDQSPSGTEP